MCVSLTLKTDSQVCLMMISEFYEVEAVLTQVYYVERKNEELKLLLQVYLLMIYSDRISFIFFMSKYYEGPQRYSGDMLRQDKPKNMQ